MAILFSAIGLLGFLDELSYGERIFGLNFPVVNGVKLDALHDLIELVVRTAGNKISEYSLFFLLILLSAIVLFGVLKKQRGLQLWADAKVDRAFRLYLVILAIGGISFVTMINDAHVFPLLHFPGFVEEILELNVSIALVSCCFIINALETQKLDVETDSV